MNIDLAPIDFLKEQYVQICIVCRGGVLTTETFNSFNEWTIIANQIGIKYKVNTIRDSNEEKNAISTYTLNTPGPTHILFIDADMIFEPHHILIMLSAKKHVIGQQAPDMTRHSYNVYTEETNLKSVSSVPGSFLMISREALGHLNGVPFFGSSSGPFGKWRDLGGHVWAHEQVTPSRT